MSDANILIAGCGDLGLRTAQRLLARSDVARVYGLRRHPPGDLPQTVKWRWLAGDLGEAAGLANVPPDITHVMFTPTPGARNAAAYERVFVHGQRHLHAALHRDRSPDTALTRWLFVSSSAVYGEHQGGWIDETTPTAPLGFNGEMLCAAEDWLHAHEPQACVLRLAGLYGPGRVQLLERLKAGLAQAPSSPPHMANRIHIDDAASACETLLMHAAPHPLYLGANDRPLPLHTLYALLAEMLDAPAPAEGSAPASVGSKQMRNARLRAAGWTPRYPDAVAGYRDLIADLPA